jgi:PAS domain S-box-containing protein
MTNKKFNVFNNPRYLIFNVLKMTILLPLSIIFFTNMGDDEIIESFHGAFRTMTAPAEGSFIIGLILILNLVIYIYLKPVLFFNKECLSLCTPEIKVREKAIWRFNHFPLFFLFISVMGYLVGVLVDIFYLRTDFIIVNVSLFYKILEAVSIGLFTGVLIYLNTENILFKVKKRVFEGESLYKQKYSSFYFKLILTLSVIILFLMFQLFDSFSSFYHLGSIGPFKGNEIEQMDIGAIFNMSRINDPLKKLVHVLLLKIFIYFLYVTHLFRQIKKMLINPLKTAEEKLVGLNRDNRELSKEIDIVNNDEFAGIYSEINQLIEKQNLSVKRSQDKLDIIVEHAADPIISFHDDGIIHVFNPAAELSFGYTKEEILNHSIIALIDFEEEQQFLRFIRDSDSRLKRITGIHKSGLRKNFETNISLSETDHGQLFTAILRDITGQMEFEENLKKAKDSAEKANRMKSEFLANMSHELRTPLNAVLGFTQLLNADKNLTKGQLDKIRTISRSGEHLLALINDILDISKIESGKTEMHKEIFDLNVFVNDLKDMFILKCQDKSLSFYVEHVGDIPPYVEGDLGKLRQIMINLIGNAVKFTDAGGISLIVGEDKGQFRFSVNDTGKGIPSNEIDKILKPFMQSSNVDHEGGTGLGLAISNSFIKMMGGDLQVESEVGKGSSFSFSIPLKITETAPKKEINSGAVISIKNDRYVKALIVDDKVDNRLVLKAMLENVGFVTMEAKNGLEAIERTEEFLPEIIFMDIKMPVMDGYEAVKQLKNGDRGQNMKIFALTASAFRHDEKKIFDSGFDGFLPKPFKQETLFQLVSDNTDVQFLYESFGMEPVFDAPDPNKLDFPLLSQHLSDEDLENLSDTILINDFAAVKDYTDHLENREELMDFIKCLRYFADNFNDQKLEQIIEQIKGQKNG